MDIQITKQEKKSLIGREEIEAQIVIFPTPSNNQVQQELAKKLNKNPELIIIKHIYPKFGSHDNKVIFYNYDNEDSLKKLEKTKQKKEEEKPGEKPEQQEQTGEKQQ